MKEFPNNWQAIKDAPSEYFEPCSYEDFFMWKLNGWDLPSSVSCIFRAENTKTGKITEHVYKNSKSAMKRLISYMQDGDHEITVVNHDSIHLICNDEHIDDPRFNLDEDGDDD